MIVTFSKGKDQPGKQGCQSCSWSAEQGKRIFPCPRSRLRIWPGETGSAVPSCVSLLISTILRLNLVLTYRIPPDFRGGAIRHRASSEFIGSPAVYSNFFPIFVSLEIRIFRVFLYYHRLLFVWRVRRTFSSSGWCLKKNQSAPRPSEHPPVRGKICQNV